MKNIIISPAIKDISGVYVSISKKSSEHDTSVLVQNSKLLEKTIKLQVPEDEEGEICVDVYKDNLKIIF